MGPAFSVPWLYLVQSYQAFSRWRNAGGTGRPDRAGRTRLDRAEPVKQGYLFSGNAFADPPAYSERISPLCGRMQRFLCAVGAFLHGFCGAAGRNRLSYIYQLITPPAKRNRAFPTGNALLYILLSSVDFSGCVRRGAPYFCFIMVGCTSNRITATPYRFLPAPARTTR